METKYSLGQKRRWKKFSKKKRSKMMSDLRKAGWAKKSKKELKLEGERLLAARQKRKRAI